MSAGVGNLSLGLGRGRAVIPGLEAGNGGGGAGNSGAPLAGPSHHILSPAPSSLPQQHWQSNIF